MEWSLKSFVKIASMSKRGYHIVSLLSLLFLFISCSENNQVAKAEYYYYPQKNVYYDPVKKSFLYSLDGTKSWNSFINSRNAQPAFLGEKIIIKADGENVYTDNSKHRKLYGGELIDISSPPSDTSFTGPEADERQIIPAKKQVAVRKAANTKPKNSIGKFVNKLFGKLK